MKKRSLWLISALMTTALLGVFAMQLYYIREAYNLKSQLFDQQVNQALSAVVKKVQKRNVFDRINKKDEEIRRKREADLRQHAFNLALLKQDFKDQEEGRKLSRQKQIEEELNNQDSIIRANYFRPTLISEQEYQALYARPGGKGGQGFATRLQILLNAELDPSGNLLGGTMTQKLISKRPKTFNLTPGVLPDTIRYLVIEPRSGQPLLISLPRVTEDLVEKFRREDQNVRRKYEQDTRKINMDSATAVNANVNLVEAVANEMRQVNIPFYKRMPAIQTLDALLRAELLNHNITQKYNFRVTMANKDSVVYIKTANLKDTFLPENTFKTTLFSDDLLRDPGMLYVSFPNKNSAILTNLGATMASSIGLLLVLIFIFTYTIYAILKHKKISEMKTDFINNMTHEFKTPVATIMIASEALKDPEIVEDKKRISRLAGIIYDENVRLGNHIERVLSIARLEKHELKMDVAEVDMNELITAVIDSMSLQLQKRNAKVLLRLNAENAIIKGDELHLSNVIYNLVDNANKYSRGEPEIIISTQNAGKNFIIEVTDDGIGMSKDHTKRIFDQFYRVPTGNLHDVKGFGLGLNYVQDIVKQMSGSIKVHSEKDKGTTFEVILPQNKS